MEAISSITATPWQMEKPKDPEVIFQEEVPQEAAPKREIVAVRRLKITAEDLRRYGLTHGCPQCDYIRHSGQHRPGVSHSDACRDRILTEIAATPAGMERLRRIEEKATTTIARYVEQNQQAPSPEPAVTDTPPTTLEERPRAVDVQDPSTWGPPTGDASMDDEGTPDGDPGPADADPGMDVDVADGDVACAQQEGSSPGAWG